MDRIAKNYLLAIAEDRVMAHLRDIGIPLGVSCIEVDCHGKISWLYYFSFGKYPDGNVHVPVAILTEDGKLHFVSFDTVKLDVSARRPYSTKTVAGFSATTKPDDL